MNFLSVMEQLFFQNISKGEVVKSTPTMPKKYFGEGITHYFDRKNRRKRIIQITWKSQEGFIYTPNLRQVDKFSFVTSTTEGWGITHDGNATFVVSDGSEFLHFWDAATLQEVRRVPVRLPDGTAIYYLNELEYVNGRVLANQWYSDNIYNIDPRSGEVMRVYDFTSLREQLPSYHGVLNGISIAEKSGELFITGKKWPNIFRVKLLDCWDDETWYFRKWRNRTCKVFLKKKKKNKCEKMSRGVLVKDSCCQSCSS
uniref:Glutamine cyclotransferase n=1 Tax=Corethron hystrix TaxID=216773 RepID=A0A7S1BHQ2_9STRA|mmetsp:Transcript_27366/g.62819  ORF Transcript_27366/g.62819 Transcript_27366/m.62819 type:complete len:256 (+) Transcript_27366:499-1266(+)